MPIFAEIPAKTVEKDAAGTGMEALSVYGTKTALSSESEAKISERSRRRSRQHLITRFIVQPRKLVNMYLLV